MRPIQSLIAVLFALGSAGALAQDQAAPTAPAPVLDGPSYGPVLDPRPATRATTERPTRASTRAIGETRPQAQEERGTPERRQARPHPRRPGAVQRIEATPRIAAPAPPPAARVPLPAPPRQVAPQSNQAMGCMGGSCTDASGAGYNAGGGGNVVLSNDGRLCTRSGANIQCL